MLKIVEFYQKAYKRRTGIEAPPINWKREGMLIKRGLQRTDVQGIIIIIEKHLENPSSQNFSLQYCLSDTVINRYIDKAKLNPYMYV